MEPSPLTPQVVLFICMPFIFFMHFTSVACCKQSVWVEMVEIGCEMVIANFWYCQDFTAGNLLVPNSDETAFLEPVSQVGFQSHISLAMVIFHPGQYVAGLKRKVVKVAGPNNKKCGMKCVCTTWQRRFHPWLHPLYFQGNNLPYFCGSLQPGLFKKGR